MLVDFTIAGTQKGGTTALHYYLSKHPDIYMPDKKELHFFDDESQNFNHKTTNYDNYHSQFKPNKKYKIIGEATPIYMYWYKAPERMWHYNKNLKIILILRNPIERAFSHWNMEAQRGCESKTFSESIRTESLRCKAELPLQHRVYSYTDRGFYSEQIKRLLFFFDKRQIFILKNEDLIKHPNAQLNNTCKFLGVSNLSDIEPRVIHSREYTSTISSSDREYLSKLYKHEVSILENMLNWNCDKWK